MVVSNSSCNVGRCFWSFASVFVFVRQSRPSLPPAVISHLRFTVDVGTCLFLLFVSNRIFGMACADDTNALNLRLTDFCPRHSCFCSSMAMVVVIVLRRRSAEYHAKVTLGLHQFCFKTLFRLLFLPVTPSKSPDVDQSKGFKSGVLISRSVGWQGSILPSGQTGRERAARKAEAWMKFCGVCNERIAQTTIGSKLQLEGPRALVQCFWHCRQQSADRS